MFDDKKIAEANNNGAAWTINHITSDSTKNTSMLETAKTTSKTIQLKEQKVTAVQTVTDNDTRVSVQFVYDDIFVVICAKPDLLTDSWFSNLNFSTVPLKEFDTGKDDVL